MKSGLIHHIECTCILQAVNNQQFRFKVFSIIDENDKVIQKFAVCPNCGVTHRVLEIGKSNILRDKENIRSVVTVEDIEKTLNEKISKVLIEHDCDVSTWEYAKFIVDNALWGKHLVISKEIIDSYTTVKILKILGNSIFTIDTYDFEGFIND